MTNRALTASQAHHKVSQAVRTGRLVRPSHCPKCGAPDKPMRDGRSSIQGHHHRGYEHPLDVEWLCVKCHREITPKVLSEKQHAAKVNWPLVDTLRERYAAGETFKSLAKELGLDPTTVHRIVTRRSWRDETQRAIHSPETVE